VGGAAIPAGAGVEGTGGRGEAAILPPRGAGWLHEAGAESKVGGCRAAAAAGAASGV
jgi:hypothetical protein